MENCNCSIKLHRQSSDNLLPSTPNSSPPPSESTTRNEVNFNVSLPSVSGKVNIFERLSRALGEFVEQPLQSIIVLERIHVHRRRSSTVGGINLATLYQHDEEKLNEVDYSASITARIWKTVVGYYPITGYAFR